MRFLRWVALATMVLVAGLAVNHKVRSATTLLPNGMQCFQVGSGPLAGGSVYMYQPNTTTFKQTWQDSSQSTLNTQPIPLDSNGCAIIYGVGSYRQQVYTGTDNSSTLVWDQTTTDTSAYNSVFWAALSGGTPNVITITYTGFNATDGTAINFVALNTNTGATTLNPSSYGAIPIVKDTTAGPVALSGGEIVAGNVVSVVYYSTTNSFHLQNTVIASASGATSPLCGASNLRISNDSGTPNTLINLTADQVVTQSTGGLVINRSSISLTINFSINGANGLDGTNTITAATWYNIWVIDNGSAAAGIASPASEGTSITMPSGYTYKCRLGAIRTAAGAATLQNTKISGQRAQYVAANTPMVNGAAGTCGNTGATTWSAITVSNYVPPTASEIYVILQNTYNNTTRSFVMVAPNTNYVGSRASSGVPPLGQDAVASSDILGSVSLLLEGTTIQWCSSQAGGAVYALGWRDSVNAN